MRNKNKKMNYYKVFQKIFIGKNSVSKECQIKK